MSRHVKTIKADHINNQPRKKIINSVVEKCLQYGSKAERNDIIDEVVRSVLEK